MKNGQPRHDDGSRRGARPVSLRGFTLVEVMVALGIVAIALTAGLKATAALTDNALRQTDMLLAQVCADNALAARRLARRLPPLGEASEACEQAGTAMQLSVRVAPTPNPNFRHVEAQVLRDGRHLLQVATVMGGS